MDPTRAYTATSSSKAHDPRLATPFPSGSSSIAFDKNTITSGRMKPLGRSRQVQSTNPPYSPTPTPFLTRSIQLTTKCAKSAATEGSVCAFRRKWTPIPSDGEQQLQPIVDICSNLQLRARVPTH